MAGLLENLFATLQQAGSTPWAQAQMHNMTTPGPPVTEEDILRMLGQQNRQAPLGVVPPSPAAQPAAPAAPMGVGGAPAAPVAQPQRERLPAPETEPTAPDRLRSAAPRPDFGGGIDGAEIIGALLQGAGGIAAPLGRLIGSSGERERQTQARNLTYDWLLKQKVPEDEAKFLTTNPAALKGFLERRFSTSKPTDEMREYEFDIAQRRARGETSLPTFGQWKSELRKAGATNVNVAGQEGSFARERGKQQAQRLDAMSKGADHARNQLANLDAIEAGLAAFNEGSWFGTGRLGPAEAAMRSYAKSVGIGNAETLAGGELATALQNRMALMMRNPDGGMGMPGALSDADRNFLSASQPGIDKTPEGNRQMIEIARRMERRKIEIGELANRYVAENGNLDGFDTALKEFTDKNPLFADMAKGKAAGVKRRKYNPTTGKIE